MRYSPRPSAERLSWSPPILRLSKWRSALRSIRRDSRPGDGGRDQRIVACVLTNKAGRVLPRDRAGSPLAHARRHHARLVAEAARRDSSGDGGAARRARVHTYDTGLYKYGSGVVLAFPVEAPAPLQPQL